MEHIPQTYTHKKALDRIPRCGDSQAEASISDDASTLNTAAVSQVPESEYEHAVSTRRTHCLFVTLVPG